MENKKRLGLALCGSYCTYDQVFRAAEKLAADTKNGTYKGDLSAVAAYLKTVLKRGDAAVIMGAGNINGMIPDIIEQR